MIAPGYSGKPLWQKLGLKEGQTLCVHNPQPGYRLWLGDVPPECQVVEDWQSPIVIGLAFLLTQSDLDHAVNALEPTVSPTGCLWVAFPKKTSKLAKELDFDKVQQALLTTRLVDTKVCAVSEDFTGLKFMVRKHLR